MSTRESREAERVRDAKQLNILASPYKIVARHDNQPVESNGSGRIQSGYRTIRKQHGEACICIAYPPSGTSEPAEQETSWYIPDWVDDMMQKVDDMIQSFKDLMSGKLIKNAIEGLIVLLVEEMMSPLYDAFAKSYLFTPQIAEIALVQSGWSMFMIIVIVLLFIGISWVTYKIIRGKKDLGNLLKVFFICFVATYFSLTALNIVNVGINWMASKMFEGIIGTSGITYEGLDGQQILKAMIVGADGITEASYSAHSDIKEAANLIHSLGGIVTIHVGSKTNGIEAIRNNEKFKQALKKDLADG